MSQTPINGIAGYPPSPYILNLYELQNTITNASGLTPITALSNAVSNIQQMVNFDQKRIFVNTISKFNQTPIQVTDDINLSNANLYINGTEVTGFGTGGGGATVISTAGGNAIYIQSTTTSNATAIGFQVAGRTVFSIDGAGRALYFDPSGTGDRFWISSAKLIADQVQLGGAGMGAAEGKFLQSIDVSGNAKWSYVSTLQDSDTKAFVSTGFYVVEGGVPGGAMDSRRNWYLGSPAFTGQGDLTTSNDVTVVGGGLRLVQGGPELGKVLVVEDVLGNIGFSSGPIYTSSFVIGDKIASGQTQVAAVGSDNSIRFANASVETARINASGFLGINTASPGAYLDVNGSAFLGGSVRMSGIGPQTNYFLQSADAQGNAQWAPVLSLDDGIGDKWLVNSNTRTIEGYIQNSLKFSLSNSGATFASTVNIGGGAAVTGLVIADGYSSRSPLRFYVGSGASQVVTVLDNGNMGIGVSTPIYKLQVVGSQSNTGDLYANNIYGVRLYGDGSNITNINTSNVGSGSNNLAVFQAQTRNDILDCQLGISTVNSNLTSTIEGINLTGGLAFYSTLSSALTITSNALSSQIGPGAAEQISSFSTALGASLSIVFDGFGSSLSNAFGQISTVSTQGYIYASTVAKGTASTLDQAVYSTIRGGLAIGFGEYAVPSTIAALQVRGNILTGADTRMWMSTGSALGIGYKTGQDLSGALDVSGLIFMRSIRSIQAPFTYGVGTSTTVYLEKGGLSPSTAWRLSVVGDIDISGYLYHNGVLYNSGDLPDFYWARNGSNIYYGDGNVGIGTPYPSYPLDVAGRIRCWGVDVIPGPGPSISTGQGPYVSPWKYQSSNIYYDFGGVGVGYGISSVKDGVMLDISGPVRQRWGGVYLWSTLALGKPYGSDLSGTLDVAGSAHFESLTVDNTGAFGGQVTAASFLTPSDMRLKDEIRPIDNVERMIHDMRGVRFRWKKSGVDDIGMIAQEISSIVPQAVYTENGSMMVSYDKLIPVLLEGLKGLSRRVENLEAEISTLRRGL